MANNQKPCCEKFKTMIGGQALIEGIMMRGPEKDAIVIRGKEGLTVEVSPRKIHPPKSSGPGLSSGVCSISSMPRSPV